jgi:hypothetical protein
MSQLTTLTATLFPSLHYIGRNQKMGAKVGRNLSLYLLEKLKEKGLAIECDGIVILTVQGQQEDAKVFERACLSATHQGF